MAAQRNIYYGTIVYPESAPLDWIEKLEEQHIRALISPLHNKDIDKDGKPKRPHYHVILIFESLKSMKQVKEIFPMLVTLGGIVISFRLLHPRNVRIPNKKALANELEICYVKNTKGVTAHKVVDLPEWLKPTCLGKVHGRLIYFRLWDYLCRQAM